MQTIIDAIPAEKIIEELSPKFFFRKTNKGDNEIYIFNAHNAPYTMREVGRLREISFRDSGGGTGLDCDLDIFDTRDERCFEQLIVWDPTAKQIVGGYRFLLCNDLELNENGQVDTPTSELFSYSKTFIDKYLPYTLELGRSFVQPDYQPSKNFRKGIYSLDNLWDGLVSLTEIYPQAKYYFGKVTMYQSFNIEARDMILYFLNNHFPDKEHLVEAYPDIRIKLQTEESKLKALFVGNDFSEDYRILNKAVRDLGSNIPPLVNAYMNLSPSMIVFGTALNAPFGNVEETGIIITIDNIYDDKVERHRSNGSLIIPEYLK